MKYISSLFILALPTLVLGASPAPNFGYVGGFFEALKEFIDTVLIPLVFTIALLLFLWGMYRWFIQGGASEDDRKKGQQLALWSIIAFVLMISIWGIVGAIADGLFGTTSDAPTIPGTPTLEN